jgi:formyltetrahydrofolate deformylase
MNDIKKYILTLSCTDQPGVVAAVSSFLANHQANIIESQQFREPQANCFFMRVEFSVGSLENREQIKSLFSGIAAEFSMQWDIFNTEYKPRVLIAVSKAGHCFNHLLHHYFTGHLPIEIVGVVSNHMDLKQMADWHDLPFHHLPVTADTKQEQEAAFYELVKETDADVVVLARYMQILSDDLSAKLKGKCINIHHSFLPGFKGANPYRQAYDRGVKMIGATAHYVTADLDEGPIIEQEVTRVHHGHTPKQLKGIGQEIESQVLSRALKYHIEHRVILNGSKTVVFN